MKLVNYLILVFAIILLSNCRQSSNGRPDAPTVETLKVGVILPLSGALAGMGNNEKEGMSIAIDDLKERGVNIDVIFSDYRSDRAEGLKEAERLLNVENVDILVTSTSGLSKAVAPLLEGDHRSLIALTMDEEVALNRDNVSRLYEGTDSEIAAIRDFLTENYTGKKVSILYVNVETAKSAILNDLVPFLQKSGVEVILTDAYDLSEANFRVPVYKLKESNPDIVVLYGYGFEYPKILDELSRDNHFDKIDLIGGWGFINSGLNPNDLEGIYVAGPEYYFKNGDIAAQFKEAYRIKFNKAPNFDSALGYNALMQIGEKYTKTNTSTPSDEVFRTSNSLGVIGEFTVDSEGNMVFPVKIGVYKDGDIVIIE